MKVHLITNCTSNKRKFCSKPPIALSEIKKNKNESVVKEWLELLHYNGETVAAIDLYLGDHWSIAREIYKKNKLVWVISAGWGLINIETPIYPYNATFTKGDPNSVSYPDVNNSAIQQNRKWWNDLHKRRCLDFSIEKLFEDFSGDYFFIAVSPQYINVIEPELAELKKKGVITSKNTFILTSGKGLQESLRELQYLVSEDFCSILGGSRISLNIRLARYLMEGCDSHDDIQEFVTQKYNLLCDSSKPAKKYDRIKLSDEEVISFIKKVITDEDIRSATAGLKKLRSKGMACEQKRFGHLFKVVKEEIHNSEAI